MLQDFKKDIDIIFEKLNKSRETSTKEYHTLTNALREIFKIVNRENTPLTKELAYFENIYSLLIEEINKLNIYKTTLLECKNYQGYHVVIKSYQDLNRIKSDIKYGLKQTERRSK